MNQEDKNKEKIVQSKYFLTKYISFFFLTILLVIFLKAGVIFSQEKGSIIERRDALFAVHFRDDKTGWVVGNKGLIVKTADGGKSWVKGGSITEKALYDITFIDDEGWVVGQRGVIFHSTDGGLRWERQQSTTEASLMGVCFVNNTKGFVIGSGSTLLTTEDGGKTWTQYPLELASILPEQLIERGVISLNFYGIFFRDGTQGWIVGDNGIVLSSSDGGGKWEVLRVGLFPTLFSVLFRDDSEGWAVGQNGLLLHTADGGKDWEELKANTEENLYKVCMKDDFWIVAGDNGTMLQSNDGKSWEKVELGLGMPPVCIIDVSILGLASSKKSVIFVGENVIKNIYLK